MLLKFDGEAAFRLDVHKLIDIHGGVFPVGGRLVLEAQVMEEATGKTENGFSDAVVFTDSPFVIDLSRSKTTFRPGMRYYLRVRNDLLSKSLKTIKSITCDHNMDICLVQ